MPFFDSVVQSSIISFANIERQSGIDTFQSLHVIQHTHADEVDRIDRLLDNSLVPDTLTLVKDVLHRVEQLITTSAYGGCDALSGMAVEKALVNIVKIEPKHVVSRVTRRYTSETGSFTGFFYDFDWDKTTMATYPCVLGMIKKMNLDPRIILIKADRLDFLIDNDYSYPYLMSSNILIVVKHCPYFVFKSYFSRHVEHFFKLWNEYDISSEIAVDVKDDGYLSAIWSHTLDTLDQIKFVTAVYKKAIQQKKHLAFQWAHRTAENSYVHNDDFRNKTHGCTDLRVLENTKRMCPTHLDCDIEELIEKKLLVVDHGSFEDLLRSGKEEDFELIRSCLQLMPLIHRSNSPSNFMGSILSHPRTTRMLETFLDGDGFLFGDEAKMMVKEWVRQHTHVIHEKESKRKKRKRSKQRSIRVRFTRKQKGKKN